jgi:hypothetical protein
LSSISFIEFTARNLSSHVFIVNNPRSRFRRAEVEEADSQLARDDNMQPVYFFQGSLMAGKNGTNLSLQAFNQPSGSRKRRIVMRLKLNAVFFAMLSAMALAIAGHAQEPAAQSPRPARQTQKEVSEPQEKTDLERAPLNADETIRRAMSSLSTQMDSLTKEMRLLRKATERNSMLIELLLYEERLAKIEDKLDAAIMLKTDLDAREAELQRRMRNIQQEVMMRGGLRRDEVEAALRSELTRALEDTRTRLALQQERISELQAQAARLRARVEALRKKLDRDEQKSEQPQQ